MTGEGLAYKLGVVERGKFEYSPLGKAFNKELDKKLKKERLLKTLKNVEDINKKQLEKQLKHIENDINNVNTKTFKKLTFLNRLGPGAKEKLDEIKEIDKEIDYTKLVCVHKNRKVFDFNIFSRLRDFIRSIYFDDISLKQAVDKNDEMEYLLRNLGVTNQKNLKK